LLGYSAAPPASWLTKTLRCPIFGGAGWKCSTVAGTLQALLGKGNGRVTDKKLVRCAAV